jgi:hypothetical protein
MAFAFRKNLGKVAGQDEATYVQLLDTQDELVAFTLNDLHDAALQVAKRAGVGQHRKVQRWIRDREEGESEFAEGMDEQAAVRNQAIALERMASGLS